MPGPGYRDPYGESGGEPAGFEGYVEEQSGGPGIIGCLLVVAATLLAAVGILLFIILFGGGGEGAVAAIDCDTASGPDYVSSEPSGEAVSDIPGDYYDIYKQAAEEHNIDWAILAAVGKIESDHGRLDAPGVTEGSNTHGCCAGPMQFDINNYNTWAAVGYDANGDGETDVYDPEDAIPSAAKYLVQGGAPDDYQSALFQYNRAQWYVDDVMAQADKYRSADEGGGDSQEPGTSPASLPLLSSLMNEAHAQEGDTPEGSGEPPLGWSFVDEGDKTMYYEVEDTSFESEFEAAAEEWNALGGVEIAPTPSGEQTDVVVSDGQLDGSLGTTSPEGTIQFDPRVAEGIGSSARKSAAVHELGHALGFDHTTEESVMAETVAAGQDNITSPTEYDEQIYRKTWGGSANGGSGDGGSGDEGPANSPAPPVEAGSEFCRNNSGPGGGEDAGGGEARGTGTGEEVYQEALKYDGVDYVLGGPAQCVPGETMDCTCLTLTVFKQFGYELPDSPQDQRSYGEPVQGEPRAGDLIIYEDPGDGTGGHAGIARGDGGIFHCASESLGCIESPDYTKAGLTPVAEVRRLVDSGESGSGSGGGSEEGSGG